MVCNVSNGISFQRILLDTRIHIELDNESLHGKTQRNFTGKTLDTYLFVLQAISDRLLYPRFKVDSLWFMVSLYVYSKIFYSLFNLILMHFGIYIASVGDHILGTSP